MNANRDLERRLADFYADQHPARAPDRVLARALANVDDTRQRRRPSLWPGLMPWRYETMTTLVRATAVLVALFIVGAGVVWFAGGRGGPGPAATPTATIVATPTATPAATAAPSPVAAATATPVTPVGSAGYLLSSSFRSNVHGISLAYPGGWEVRPATSSWTEGVPMFTDDFNDVMFDSSQPDLKFIGVASQPLGELTDSQWIEARRADPEWQPECPPTTEAVTVDGSPGLLQTICPNGLFATFVAKGDRGYLLVVYGVGDRSVVDALLGTVRLRPEEAFDAGAPGPFVSP